MLTGKALEAMLRSQLTAPAAIHKRRRVPAAQQAQARRWMRAVAGLGSGEYIVEGVSAKPNLFIVRKVEAGAAYKVRLGSGLPVCTCPDWKRHGHGHICKHIVMAQLTVPAVAYVGIRLEGEVPRVWVVRNTPPGMETVKPLRHIVRHSPTGFEWGYLGSGPSDLAYSILADYAGKDVADSLAVRFKEEVVARLPHAAWMLTEDALQAFLRRHPAAIPVQIPAPAYA